jgi:long-chain fatty acid transport protein
MTRMSGIAAIVGAALVCVLGAREARASGFAIRENSAEALGTSFAGNASSATFLSTIFNNPAGMTEFTGDRGQTDGSLIVPSLKFSGSAHETCAGLGKFPAFCPPVPTSFPIAGDNGGDAGKSAFIPALYALHSISPDLKFGLAMTVPFGLETQYSNTWVGRYLGIKSMVQSLDINPNLAYRVNDWISVGGGISANYLYADLSKAIDFNAISHNPPGLLPDGQARFNGSDWNWGYNLGVLLKPMEGTNLGIAFRSRIQHKLQGDQNFTSIPFPFSLNPVFANSPGQVSLNLPANLDVSVTQKITDQLHIAADVQWTQWSGVQQLVVIRDSGSAVAGSLIPEHFRDTVFASVGATYNIDEHWTVRAGVAYDESPVTDGFRTVALPDADRYWISFGGGYKFSDGFSVDVGYAHIFIPGSPSISSSVNGTATFPGGVDKLTGSYQESIDLISLQTRFRF